MSEPKVAIAITADDKTAKGWSSAEKRAGRTIGKIGASNRDGLKEAQDGIARSSRGIVKSFSAIEQAGSRAMSGGSIIGRAGAVRELGVLGRGLGATAAEAIGLEGALVGVTGAAVGLGAVAIAAGAAMWKLSDGWGKGANQLGNMASLIGVSTKGLQEFAGAAERVGVDKDTATGTLGSLSQTLNDARYGRNNGALAMLGKLGVKLETNQDGTVNVEKMLPVIATAIAAQNSSGRRTSAHALGISDAALAAFTQGGSALSANMADYGANGAVITDADTKLGRALTRRDTIGTQRLGKMWLGVQRANATAVKDVGDAAVDAVNGGGPDLSGLSPIGTASAQEMPVGWREAPAGMTGAEAGHGFGMERTRRGPWRSGGRMSARDVDRRARHALPAFQRHLRDGLSPEEAAAWAANGEAESGNNSRSHQPGGPGRGTYQWGSFDSRLDRRPLYRQITGKEAGTGTDEDDERMRRYELSHQYRGAQRAVDAATSAGDKAAAIVRRYEIPADIPGASADRSNIAERIIRLEIDFKNAPHGVTAKASSGSPTKPAISMAHSY